MTFLNDSYYFQLVLFVELQLIDSVMKIAKKLRDKNLLFAYNSNGVKMLNV